MKILIIDDQRFTRNLVNLSFSRDGHDVLMAENGQEGLKVALEEKPDIILLDIMMPKIIRLVLYSLY